MTVAPFLDYRLIQTVGLGVKYNTMNTLDTVINSGNGGLF